MHCKKLSICFIYFIQYFLLIFNKGFNNSRPHCIYIQTHIRLERLEQSFNMLYSLSMQIDLESIFALNPDVAPEEEVVQSPETPPPASSISSAAKQIKPPKVIQL